MVYFFFPETYKLGLEEVAQILGDDITDITMSDKGGDMSEKRR